MPSPIADYAFLSNCRTAALVSREGSIDWLCLPRFDSPSVFGALLGREEHGCWALRPRDADASASRRYDGDSFTLITRWETATGTAEVHDLLIVDEGEHDLLRRLDVVRRIVGIEGSVEFEHRLRMRFDYARALPWVRQAHHDPSPALLAVAGVDGIRVTGVALEAEDHVHHGTVTAAAGSTEDAVLTWYPSHLHAPEALDVDAALAHTRDWWQGWAARIRRDGTDGAGPEVVRSLLVLRALTHRDTGGIVAAATTSLPEQFGGERNWDYRYVWLRDAALTLQALTAHGFLGVERHWRSWLLRAIAGDPAQLQIMYGLAGERDLFEREIDSLPGYDGAAPVRIGNGASTQFQGDVIGEVIVALDAGRTAGLADSKSSWPLEVALLRQAEARIDQRDNGLWEIRGEPQFFTHSRVMTWAAFDSGVRAVEQHGLDGPVERWRALRDRLRAEIDAHGYDAERGHFVQHYGSADVDASLLLLPRVGYCAADDPRMVGTVAAIEEQLMSGGLLHRYRTESGVDGLAGTENPFLACSFWLVEQYAAMGRIEDAEALMARASATANDLGLLSEQFDTRTGLQAGNTPQAFSHLALVGAADALARARVARP